MNTSPAEGVSSVDLYLHSVLSCSERYINLLSKPFLKHKFEFFKLISFYLFLNMLRQPKLKQPS